MQVKAPITRFYCSVALHRQGAAADSRWSLLQCTMLATHSTPRQNTTSLTETQVFVVCIRCSILPS